MRPATERGLEGHFGLFRFPVLGTCGPTLLDFAQFDAGKTDRAARRHGSLDVARGQLPLGSGFGPADTQKQETHVRER